LIPEEDMVEQIVGSKAYILFWNPDFLNEKLGRKGTVARFYPEKRMAIDIGNPESSISRKKQRLLARHGFNYLCIPPK
jgi:hypothetical protein